MKSSVIKISSQEELNECFTIRRLVFIKGQNVPLEEDLDGKDPESQHYLLKVDGQSAGVARVRFIKNYAKIERVAVLDSFQNKGLGKQLMEAIMADLKSNPELHSARLSSQTHAIAFYERLGFSTCGEEYFDAGIPHKEMHFIFSPVL
jgi:predicted GNAT family N-acyltransferase